MPSPLARQLAAAATALMILALPAAADQSARAPIGADRIVGGSEVRISEPSSGDLLVAGGQVDVDAPVAGDLIAFGGQIRLRQSVGQSIFSAGGQLQIDSTIGRHLRVAAGELDLSSGARVAGNVTAAGGRVRLLGTVDGHVLVAGGDVLIDGPVSGDVAVTAGELALGPNARIAGQLRYRSGEELRRDPAAQVAGGVAPLVAIGGGRRTDGEPSAHTHRLGLGWGLVRAWVLGLMLVAAVWITALPGFSGSVSTTLRERKGMSLLLGFGLLVGTPVAIVVLIITVIGLPLALLALALYLALLPLAYVLTAIGVGDAALRRWKAARAAHAGWRIGTACAVLALLAALAWVPVLGALLAFAALLAGLGALALRVTRAGPQASG